MSDQGMLPRISMTTITLDKFNVTINVQYYYSLGVAQV